MTASSSSAHRETATHTRLPPRRLLGTAIVALLLVGGWTAYASVRGHPVTPLQVLEHGEQKIVVGEQRLVQGEKRLAHQIKVELAKEYSAIRPADTDAKSPPIPPSETWPAQ